MACQNCVNNCCIRWCVEELLCSRDCCGCCHIEVLFGPNLDIPAGQWLGQKTDDKRMYPFDPMATDGTQKPKGIAKYHYQTDANGDVLNRWFNPLVPGSLCGEKYGNMYVCGIFRNQDLRGETGAAESAGRGVVLYGDENNGEFKLY